MWIRELRSGNKGQGLGAAAAPVTGAAIWIGALILLESRWVLVLLLSTFGYSALRLLGAWLSPVRVPDHRDMPRPSNGEAADPQPYGEPPGSAGRSAGLSVPPARRPRRPGSRGQ